MVKKLLYIIFTTLIIIFMLLNMCYATDIVMDLNTSNNSTTEDSIQAVDDTIYSENANNIENENPTTDSEQVTVTTTTEYENETELSISNIINIVLISVGIVLILLGIAIIIKLK